MLCSSCHTFLRSFRACGMVVPRWTTTKKLVVETTDIIMEVLYRGGMLVT